MEGVNFDIEGVFTNNVNVNGDLQKQGNHVKLVNRTLEDNWIKIEYNNPNFIHDSVFKTLFQSLQSDKRLKHLTPDYVDDEMIVEITTTVSSNPNELLRILQSKINKYQEVKGNRKLLVIVISFNITVSNYDISENLSLVLCQNLVVLHNLRAELLREGKSYWVNSNESKFSKKINELLINYEPICEFSGIKKSLSLIDEKWAQFDFHSSLKSVVQESHENITKMIKHGNYVEPSECDVKFPTEGKLNLKRITVIPMICPIKREESSLIKIDKLEHIVLSSKKTLINAGLVTQRTQDDFFHEMTLPEILSGYYEDKQKLKKERKGYQFKPNLSPTEMLELNLDGIMAKSAKLDSELIKKRKESKIPFSVDVETHDIDEFFSNFPNLLIDDLNDVPSDSIIPLMRAAHFTIRDANINLRDQGSMMIDNHLNMNHTKLFNWLNFVSDLMFEINLSLRENTKGGFFIVKALHRYKADVYIKTTKSNSHIFFFIVAHKDYLLSDTIGPKFVNSENIYVSEWGSMLKRDLENFLNMKETVLSTFHCYDEIFQDSPINSKNNAKCLSLLILLNNKDRNEEIITSLRYTYMKSLSLTENSCTMNIKLNTLFRDRLQVYLTKKIYFLNNYLSKNKPQVTVVDNELETFGLKDIFLNDINFKEAINLSYAGYIMTKVKQPQANQSSKMIEKIVEYEEKFLSIQPEEISVNPLHDEKPHCFDYEFVRTFSEIGKAILAHGFGKNFEQILDDRIIKNLSLIDFESLTTLKASAKMDLSGEYNEENLKKLKSARPRVLSNVVQLIKDHDPQHYVDLIKICIEELVEKDCFNVELFPKDQHNGLREIYVIDIRARFIQLFLETISRSICSFFQSETLNHPKNSTALIPKVLKNSLEKNKNPFCLMKSGDASKWSQSQVVSKFYIVLKTFLPNKYHKIVKDSLSLWFDKKIFLPPSLIDSFMSVDFKSTNSMLNNLREGKLEQIFRKGNMFMTIKSGFMQGILHHTSSLFHTIVQEGFRQIQAKLLTEYFSNSKYKEFAEQINICVLQGSDDSSMSMSGDARIFLDNKELFLSLMHLKDIMSYKFGIIPSKEKTATCVPFIIEYNSQWLALGKSVQPTIKFAMVSCQLPSAQSLIQRQEFYYNLLKDCLEKGCSTSTCFKIKLCQLNSFYNLLGCNTTSSFSIFSSTIIDTRNPSLGFFILEPVVATAVFGFDFSFYCHMKGVTVRLLPEEYLIPTETLLPSGNTARVNAHISKTSWNKWKNLLQSVGDLNEKEREYVELNPIIFYEKTFDTYESMIKIKSKIHDFDVKQSLASRYGITENMSSFFVTFIKVCQIGKEKDSLVGWMTKCINQGNKDLTLMFPRCKTYDEILRYISQLSDQSYLVNADYIQRGRTQTTVLHNKTTEHELFVDCVKNTWFDLPVDDTTKKAYLKLFKEYQNEHSWLKDSEKETREHLKCSSRQLANFVRNTIGKNRVLTFYDTVAKGTNYPYLLTRIFQKGKKIQLIRAKEHVELKNEDVFSNMKILLNLPYNEEFKQETIKKLIQEVNLDEMMDSEKNKFSMLKYLISGNENQFALELFKFSKLNHVSWYSQAQFFNKTEKIWTGSGCLNTCIGFLYIRSSLEDNQIVNIQVNDLEGFKNNLSTYLKIVKEHRLNYDDNMSDVLKLTSHGISTKYKGTPITITSSMHFDLSRLRNVSLVLSNGNMKLMAPMIENEDQSTYNKVSSLQELFFVERKRKAKNFEERRKSNDQGFIFEKTWIDSKLYKKDRDGPIEKRRFLLSGKDVKLSTILNFEIWKKVTLFNCERMFDWGKLGTMIVNNETINEESFVREVLRQLHPSTPIDEIFKVFMHQNHFSPSEFLSYISRVQFFHEIVDPEYDEKVVKDKEIDVEKEMSDFFRELLLDNIKLGQAMEKTKDLDTCLINLGDVITNTSRDLEYTRFSIYGLKEAQSTFPNSLLYTFNHNLKRQVPDEDELIEIMSKGDEKRLLSLNQRIAMKLFFDTPLLEPRVNTVKKLNELLLLGYTLDNKDSTRSSRSSSRLSLYTPDNEEERMLMKKFRLSPKMDEFDISLREEIIEIQNAIIELSEMLEKTNNKRVRYPLITQIAGLNEDLSLLKKFLHISREKEREEGNFEIFKGEEKSLLVNDSDVSEPISQYISDRDQDDISEDISQDIPSDNFDLQDSLDSMYQKIIMSKIESLKYINLNPYDWFMKELNIDDIIINSEHTVYLDGSMANENDFGILTYWLNSNSDDVIIYYMHETQLIKHFDKFWNKKLKKISPLPGGSCLFNAISHLLTKQNKSFSQESLRKIVYESTHEIHLDLDHHRQRIMDNNEWGNENDISCLCFELNINVFVITSYKILDYGSSNPELGYLINYENIHFDVIE